MMSTFLADDVLTPDLASAFAPNGVTSKQVTTVADLARASGQDRDVQAADDYDGYRFRFIETAMGGDEQKNFFTVGTAQRLEAFKTGAEGLALIGTSSDTKTLEARWAGLVRPQ